MRFITLFALIISFIAASSSAFAQENSIMPKLKAAQEKACTGKFFYGDSDSYDLNYKKVDLDKMETSALYKAIGSQKEEFFIAICMNDNDVKLVIYVKPKKDKFYYKTFTGFYYEISENGEELSVNANLDSDNILLNKVLIPDPQKKFADDINKLDIKFLNDGIEIKFIESFFEQTKVFKESAKRGGSERLETIIPFIDKPEKPDKGDSQEDWDDYNEEMKEYEAKLKELENPILDRLQKVGYTYSMLFISVDGKKMGSFNPNDLKLQGVNLDGLDKFPQGLPIELLFIGFMYKEGHYELDIISILKGAEGKDLLYFEQTNYSKKVPIRLGDTPFGSIDNIMFIYEYCEFITDCKPSILISRKATRNGFDVIDLSDPSNARSIWGDTAWTLNKVSHADFAKGNQKPNVNAVFVRASSVNLNLTEDESGAVILLIKQKVGSLQKQYVKELLGQDIE